MRALALCCIAALALAVSPAMGRPAGGADKDPAGPTTTATAANTNSAPATTAEPAAKPAPSSSEIESELQQMRDLLESQSKQLQEQQQRMQLLEEQLNAANAARENPAAIPASADPVAIGPSAAIASGNALANGGSGQDKTDAPTSISYKGVTITPGGFMAAETVWRQKALSADVNTPFSSTPFNGSSAAHVSEFNASGRQSRFSLLTEGKLANVKIGGYYETDFLSAGTTSNDNQSNSYTLRQRQFWGQAAFNSGWTFTGGQQWSLLTETTHGMDNRTEALPQTIDAQYTAGFSWARQFGFRVTKNFNNKVWLGMAVEEAQSTLTVHGNTTANSGGTTVCTNAGCTTTSVVNPTVLNNFLVGQFGASGGQYSPTANYAYNRGPDLVFKAVFEPGIGHYEVFGLVSQFRDRIFPCVVNSATLAGCDALPTSAFGASNDGRVGGGAGVNARWNLLAKKIDVGFHFFGGDGIGRYGSVGLPDATVRPDGTLAPLRNYQTLGTLQFHPTPKLDINLNVGGEYSDRAAYAKASGALQGYGATTFSNTGCWTETLPVTGPSTTSNTGVPTGIGGTTGFIPGPLGSCTGDTRNLIEGTIGFWYRFYKGPKGTVQYGMQYSNFVRNTWRGVGTVDTPSASGQPHSDENMVFTSFRYYLP
jgi:hypothetical protein